MVDKGKGKDSGQKITSEMGNAVANLKSYESYSVKRKRIALGMVKLRIPRSCKNQLSRGRILIEESFRNIKGSYVV
ncbi:unnamed protein product [Prunus armeniaca]|uniref:Uncharacterized protein n=1 Tax=Prunus armeniaca TaxID=36596 RepID=A0A6J5UHQ4_PRUAR|nr:unnamed protein product [Prunus armeniaca]CAB4305328.1 unnamed protein product [Prunus armeniaca]